MVPGTASLIPGHGLVSTVPGSVSAASGRITEATSWYQWDADVLGGRGIIVFVLYIHMYFAAVLSVLLLI